MPVVLAKKEGIQMKNLTDVESILSWMGAFFGITIFACAPENRYWIAFLPLLFSIAIGITAMLSKGGD